MKGPRMAAPRRKLRLSGEARRALELLVDQHGTTEALMLAHGFTRRLLVGLVRARLARWYHKTVRAGGRTIEVNYMRITNAGRRALEGGPGALSSLDREPPAAMRHFG
jgi:hypothetical protein